MTTRFVSLPRPAKVYLGGVIVFGLFAIGHSVYALCSAPVTSQWFLLAALTLLSGSITIKLPSIPATISVSETFVFTSVLLFGAAAGTITVTLDGLIISLWLQRKNLELHKLLFNTTAPALSIWIAAQLFFLVTGAAPPSVQPAGIPGLIPGLLMFAVAYFLLNSWLMAFAVSFEKPLSPFQVWRQNFLWLSLSYFSGASVAILLVSLNREVDLSALAVIVPLLVISYLTYHTSMGRVEDANRHVDKLDRLYLSTIETLAMAIDAKDQITHGHIRRVQDYSVWLARQLGVNDEKLLRAIAAASLLHDMGKLAIPEYILNKPGKLTAAEFEIMKVHASAGADLLAAIEFPYPVVPIVRHHHEDWNGDGYPDRLAGTDIPIGARILSVVDCFDALTSDRPYRSKLTDSDALAILGSRRGTMYDPLVIDAFIETHGRFIPSAEPLPQDTVALTARTRLGREIQKSSSPPSGLVVMAATDVPILPYSVEVIATYLTRISVGSLLVLYAIDEPTSALRVARAWGPSAASVENLRIPLGKRLSGWVAANYTPIHDADPSVDFATEEHIDPKRFSSCAATPVIFENRILGVLTIYMTSAIQAHGFSDRNLEFAGAHVSSYLASLYSTS